jgi:hypothetical protein
MTKILYIPTGEYMTWISVTDMYHKYTESMEEAGFSTTRPSEVITWIVETESAVLFKIRNNLPKDVMASEFEIIYD